jgi:hypothetical protein
MVNNDSKPTKSKKVRKLPLIAGILTLYLAVMSEIPFGLLSIWFGSSFQNITLELMTINGVQHYFWGIIQSGNPLINFANIISDNLFPFLLWLLLAFSGILSLAGSSYLGNPAQTKKIVKIGTYFLFFEIFYYVTQYFFFLYSPGTTVTLGLGVFAAVIPLILNILGIIRITDYVAEEK